MDTVKLSKYMSLVLRHDPVSAGLTLDPDGYVTLDLLLKALKSKRGFESVRKEDVVQVVTTGSKPRFEIAGNYIRARWGHSIEERIRYEAAEPPELLFHGTSRESLNNIFSGDGLKPMARQYVHLSPDKQTALSVGGRHDRSPLLLRVEAKKAWNAGILFYQADPGIWLADQVPPEYLTVVGSR